MALKSLVNKLSDKITSTLTTKSDRGPWQPESGPYPLLLEMTDDDLKPLAGKSGVFILWHRGVRPQWIFTGFGADLAAAFTLLRADSDIQAYDLNEGVYAAWALVPIEGCLGIVRHLCIQGQPAIVSGPLAESLSPKAQVAPVQFPMPVD